MSRFSLLGPPLKPVQAKVLVGALGLLVFVFDMVVPADLDVAIFYSFVVVVCSWTGSLRFLWITTAVFTVITVPGLVLTPAPLAGPISWVDWANRIFGMGCLLLVATFIHFRMRSFRLMEATVTAKEIAEKELRDSEARLKLAQQAGRIGSWDWNSRTETYRWSEECCGIFGIEDRANSFAEQWINGVHPTDRPLVQAAMTHAVERGEFDLDYRYEHPALGTRWISSRAKMFTDRDGVRCLFGICHDVTHRKQVESALQQAQRMLESLVEKRTAELRKLSSELLKSQDEERRRIARELHDSFGQYLASLKINLDLLAGAGGPSPHHEENTTQRLSDCLDIVQRCIAETRTLSHLLHPPLLDEAGLPSAVRWYIEGFAQRSNIKVKLELRPDFPRLTPAVELALFRILQESLTNVHRYSGSPVVFVTLVADSEEVALTIKDHGCGIRAEVLQRFREHGTGVGVGLSGMRERMSEVGGRLEVVSEEPGTEVQARVPLPTSRLITMPSKGAAAGVPGLAHSHVSRDRRDA